MLGFLKARLAYHVRASKSSLCFFKSNPLSTLMTVLVIAIALALPTLFLVFTDNVHQLGRDWQRGGHISLYLDSSSVADESAILEQVRTTPGVGEATLKSSADGLAELQQQDGMQDIMQYLPENPLPAVIDVMPAADVNTADKSSELYQVLKSYPHVEQARVDMQWVQRLYGWLDISTKMARGTMTFLALAVILIIGNTLRMTIHNRHEEIEVLSFIGASNSYIIRPFLYLGVFYGLFGALVSILLIHGVTLSLASLINQIAETGEMHYAFAGLSFEQVLLLLLSAMALGWIGARLSVRSLLV